MTFRRSFQLARAVCATLCVVILFAVSATAMTVRPPTFAELVDQAESIVHVTVDATRCQWDTTPTGQRVIHTYVSCRVHEVMKGAPAERIELRFLGGDVGSEHLVIADMPKFAVGGEYVLFVAGNNRAFCPLVHVMHGSFPVVTDASTGERRVVRHDREPLQQVDDVSRPFATRTFAPDGSAMTLGQFRAAIAAQQNAGAVSHAR